MVRTNVASIGWAGQSIRDNPISHAPVPTRVANMVAFATDCIRSSGYPKYDAVVLFPFRQRTAANRWGKGRFGRTPISTGSVQFVITPFFVQMPAARGQLPGIAVR